MTRPVIRPLQDTAEYRACVALQRAVWGEAFEEAVPAALLRAAQEMGGVASGAFVGDRLVGFVFGITGLRQGELAHWSDMLAVDPAYRGNGLGRLLKLHQRDRVLEHGVARMLWTFDPLMALNAHLNLTILGATARTYRRDAYGETGSVLHAGLGTDRLLAEWDLRSERVLRRVGGAREKRTPDALPLLNEPETTSRWPRPNGCGRSAAPRVGVVVPADILAIREDDPALARAWRGNVREAMERAFESGYVAVDAGRAGPGLAVYAMARGF